MKPVSIVSRDGPIVLAQPHSGIYVPSDVHANLNDVGRALLDTDWHIPTLYDGLLPDATVIRANFSRYVIDANRDPEGRSLYPGQNTTDLVPTTTFDGEPIWNERPTDTEIAARLENYHKPYHDALRRELDRVKSQHGFVILYDCHSIRSVIPHLFDGHLPDLNIGTNQGASCAPDIERAVGMVCERQDEYSYVINGRFQGGWTTRHYGRPQEGYHAIQMELSQINYLRTEHPPFTYNVDGSTKLRAVLSDIFTAIKNTLNTKFWTEVISGQSS